MATSEPRALPPLACFAHQDCPAFWLADYRTLQGLPTPAKEALWQLLGPFLTESLGTAFDTQLEAFAAEHGVRKADLSRWIRVLRFALRSAYEVGCTRAHFAEDLTVLWPADAELCTALLQGFPVAMEQLGKHALLGALRSHGPVLEGLEWRVDSVLASSQGRLPNAQVLMLELTLRRNNQTEKLSLQVLPEQVKQLQDMLRRVQAR